MAVKTGYWGVNKWTMGGMTSGSPINELKDDPRNFYKKSTWQKLWDVEADWIGDDEMYMVATRPFETEYEGQNWALGNR